MELAWINQLRSRPGSELLGDDAAVIGEMLYTVDMLAEGVDFLLDRTDPMLIGRKALAVNLSDIAAMGGVPTSVLIALTLPKDKEPLRLTERLYTGMLPLLDHWNIPIAGGDTNTWAGGLVLAITAIGRTTDRGALRRSGGKPGDRIFVTGPLGGSILGKHLTFEPRISEALFLNKHYEIHAAIDISDGLSLDLFRMATESRLGATLFEEFIPVASDAVELAGQTGKTPIEHALSDGEDFELLLAVPPRDAEKLLAEQPLRKSFHVTLYEIGELTVDRDLKIRDRNGAVRPLPPKGFVHD